MKLDKIKNTFNDYKCELSWGQLEVIAAALESDHSDPVADELHAELQWYLQRVPGPGEEEEEAKARENGGMPGPEGDESGLPVPPTEGEAPKVAGAPGKEAPAAGGLEAPPEGELEGGSGEESIDASDLEAALSGDAPVPEPGLENETPEPDLAAPPAE